MNVTTELHDWRILERIVGLTSRLGCRYTALDVRANGVPSPAGAGTYHASIDFDGPPDALRRLGAQLTRLLADDKEMSR